MLRRFGQQSLEACATASLLAGVSQCLPLGFRHDGHWLLPFWKGLNVLDALFCSRMGGKHIADGVERTRLVWLADCPAFKLHHLFEEGLAARWDQPTPWSSLDAQNYPLRAPLRSGVTQHCCKARSIGENIAATAARESADQDLQARQPDQLCFRMQVIDVAQLMREYACDLIWRLMLR